MIARNETEPTVSVYSPFFPVATGRDIFRKYHVDSFETWIPTVALLGDSGEGEGRLGNASRQKVRDQQGSGDPQRSRGGG